MNNDKFTSIMAKAQQLMLDENFNRAVDRKAAAFSGRSAGTYGGSDLSMMESQAFGVRQRPVQMIQPSQQSVRGVNALPEYMRESFTEMPPIQGDVSSVNPLSMLEQTLSIPNKPVMTESMMPQQPMAGNNGSIDYTIIKAIIDESVKRNLSEMKKEVINEGISIKGVHVGAGNKIQFLDSKGNLYEGVLTLKKRAEKK